MKRSLELPSIKYNEDIELIDINDYRYIYINDIISKLPLDNINKIYLSKIVNYKQLNNIYNLYRSNIFIISISSIEYEYLYIYYSYIKIDIYLSQKYRKIGMEMKSKYLISEITTYYSSINDHESAYEYAIMGSTDIITCINYLSYYYIYINYNIVQLKYYINIGIIIDNERMVDNIINLFDISNKNKNMEIKLLSDKITNLNTDNNKLSNDIFVLKDNNNKLSNKLNNTKIHKIKDNDITEEKLRNMRLKADKIRENKILNLTNENKQHKLERNKLTNKNDQHKLEIINLTNENEQHKLTIKMKIDKNKEKHNNINIEINKLLQLKEQIILDEISDIIENPSNIIENPDELMIIDNNLNTEIDNINTIYKTYEYDKLNKTKIRNICWRIGCNKKSVIAPRGRYNAIYCKKHGINIQQRYCCKIDNCNKLATYAGRNSKIPTRCKFHAETLKEPSSMIYNKCKKYRCIHSGIYSLTGNCNKISYCKIHKPENAKLIRLYCNHYKCNNIPSIGNKEDKYPLVCKDHINDMYINE